MSARPRTFRTARTLLRGPGSDWFALGHVEAVRSALGVPPGNDDFVSASVLPGLPENGAVELDVPNVLAGVEPAEQSNPALARSIAHRFPYLDPLNHLQVELLRRYRQRSGRPDKGVESVERLQRGIHLSINGIAAGLRNTG